MGQNKKGGS
jgi:hypothetical protein